MMASVVPKRLLVWCLALWLPFFAGCEQSPSVSALSQIEQVESYLFGFGDHGITLPYQAHVVGSGQCVDCHQQQCDQQHTHHMAQTGSAITEATRDRFFAPEMVAQPYKKIKGLHGIPGAYRVSDDGVWLEMEPEGDGQKRAKASIAFGSRSFTTMSVEDGRRLRELPVSYSAVKHCWFQTPGQPADSFGKLNSVQHTEHCLSCHASYVSWENDRLNVTESQFGISCERCHGPGSAHLDAVHAGDDDLRIYNPGILSPKQQVEFCSQCHRRPGELNPRDVMNLTGELARHAGAGLMLSKCFTESPADATISCLDCHDPHMNSEEEDLIAPDRYNASCIRCHEDPAVDHTTVDLAVDADCIACHMQIGDYGHGLMEFTSHWIRNPKQDKPLGSSQEREVYDALADAYHEVLDDPSVGNERKAIAATSLAEVLIMTEQPVEGMQQLKRAIDLDPNNAVAFERRAAVYRMLGRNTDAITDYSRAIELEPTSAALYMGRAAIYAEVGDNSAAGGDLTRAQGLLSNDDPLQEQIRKMLRQINR
ncbi:MAG: tetratricopeptide repeat protein [Planctomycetota bacterium]|nr:tetratricopeptide repeat protein [Planctomycetota bacterium]